MRRRLLKSSITNLRSAISSSPPPFDGRVKALLHESSAATNLSIWRGIKKKEMSKESLLVIRQLKRLQNNEHHLADYIKFYVSRLLKSDLLAVLAEFQRQENVFLSMKVYHLVRREIWYRPDMFFYRDMVMMLARNKEAEVVMRVWEDSKRERVHYDQHTFGDIVRCLLDGGLPTQAMQIYEEMRESTDPPLSLPYRVMLKGLLPYPDLRERVKEDFLELFPGMYVDDDDGTEDMSSEE